MADHGHRWPRYHHPALAVDGAVLVRRPEPDGGARTHILLIERGGEPFAGSWALPGGFVDYGEDPDVAVTRELAEETGLRDLPLRQFHTFGGPDRDPRGHTVSVIYVAELVGDLPPVAGGDDAARARWFPVDELPPLAFDHDRVLARLLAGLGLI
jgi:8-oxo-dGTP diphosphatase